MVVWTSKAAHFNGMTSVGPGRLAGGFFSWLCLVQHPPQKAQMATMFKRNPLQKCAPFLFSDKTICSSLTPKWALTKPHAKTPTVYFRNLAEIHTDPFEGRRETNRCEGSKILRRIHVLVGFDPCEKLYCFLLGDWKPSPLCKTVSSRRVAHVPPPELGPQSDCTRTPPPPSAEQKKIDDLPQS